MYNIFVRRPQSIYGRKTRKSDKFDNMRPRRYDIFDHLIRNSVFEGSNLKWYSGLVRDSLQVANYREVN